MLLRSGAVLIAIFPQGLARGLLSLWRDAVPCRCLPSDQSFFDEEPSAHGRTLQEALMALTGLRTRNYVDDTCAASPFQRQAPRAAADSTTLAVHMQHPALFWASSAGPPPDETPRPASAPGVTARTFARGSDMLIVLEPDALTAGVALSVHWPWQNVLAGEAQFAQLMYTMIGNLGELGGEASASGRRKSMTAIAAQPALPESLRLADEPDSVVINVSMQRTFFDVEGHAADNLLSGQGPELARMRLSDSNVQVRIAAGALLPLLPANDSPWLLTGVQFLIRGARGLCGPLPQQGGSAVIDRALSLGHRVQAVVKT